MSQNQRVGIVGAGVVGLASALFLVKAGYKVTIVARDLPGDDTTAFASPWAGALLAPYPGGDADMQKKSLDFYLRLSIDEPASGVRSIPIIEYYDDREDDSTIWYKTLFPDFRWIPRVNIPSHAKIGFRYTGLIVDPNFFLPWLSTKLVGKGVKFIRAEIESLIEARRMTGAELIVNASGLGAEKLARDRAVHSVRGQTMFVTCRYERAVIFQGSQYTYAIPRPLSGGVSLGGISQPRSTNTAIDVRLKSDILRRVNKIADNDFQWVDLEKDARDIVGFRPAREGGIRLEGDRNTVHAYGAAGLGYLYTFGMAREVKRLIRSQEKL